MSPLNEAQPERRAVPSERVMLARVALDAALSVNGVVSGDAGRFGTWVTADGEERLPGVLVTARAGGGFAVELHLVAQVVPLHPLAERIREQVARAAAGAGLADVLGNVDVTFEDVVERAKVGLP